MVNLALTKTARLVGFLNKKRNHSALFFYGLTFALIVLVATQSLNLAVDIFCEVRRGEFKEASRRLGWYIMLIFPFIKIANDEMFYFPISGNEKALLKQKNLIEKTYKYQDQLTAKANLIVIAAEIAMTKIKSHAGLQDETKSIKQFLRLLQSFLNDFSSANKNRARIISAKKVRAQDNAKETYFRARGLVCLRDLARLLPTDQYPWFVTGGTCLGLAREGNLLAHDFDIDTGIIYSPGLEHELTAIITKNSNIFETIKCDLVETLHFRKGAWLLEKRPAFLKLIHANGINIDIFFHYISEKGISHGSSKISWINTHFDLREGHIDCIKVLHPHPLDHYLTEHYGNWNVVRKNFYCAVHTTNICAEPSLVGIAQNLKSLLYSTEYKEQAWQKVLQQFEVMGLVAIESNRVNVNFDFFEQGVKL